MPNTIVEHARATADGESAVLFCRHRAYGVGMFDTAEVVGQCICIGDRRPYNVALIVLDPDACTAHARTRGSADVIIGTVSHCHGALTRLVIERTSDSTVG